AMGTLLARQSRRVPRVPLVYVSEAERALPQRTTSYASARQRSLEGGPTGTRTRDLRIKRPGADEAAPLENGCVSDAAASDVRVVYASQRVVMDRTTICTELLHAAEHGEDTETRALAVRLAHHVLASPAIQLAHEVLAGGEHAATKAIELAEKLLLEG